MRNAVLTSFAVFFLTLSGCQYLPGTDAYKERQAEQGIAASLIDPSSAQFRNVAVKIGVFHKESVCGEINGKNRMGAYTGFVPFYADPKYPALGKIQNVSATDPGEANRRLARCQNEGGSCQSEVIDAMDARDAAHFQENYDSACNGIPSADDKDVMRRVGIKVNSK